VGFQVARPAHGLVTEWFLFTPSKLPEHGAVAAGYCRVVARREVAAGKAPPPQFGKNGRRPW